MKNAGTFDKKLMLLEPSSNLTSTTTGNAVDFHGDDVYPLNVRAVVKSVSGTSPKMVLEYQGSDDGTNWTTIYTFPDIEAAGEYNKKILGKGRYRRVKATLTGTSPNFGMPSIGISTGGMF